MKNNDNTCNHPIYYVNDYGCWVINDNGEYNGPVRCSCLVCNSTCDLDGNKVIELIRSKQLLGIIEDTDKKAIRAFDTLRMYALSGKYREMYIDLLKKNEQVCEEDAIETTNEQFYDIINVGFPNNEIKSKTKTMTKSR